ncbi:MAG: hypothetical protein Q8O62_09995 [Aequorivita sp.]|nr:hypothetical protein [Aequorivita sp.]
MKPATHFYSSFPQHLLPAVPALANTPQNAVASATQPRQFIWPELNFKQSLDNFRLYKAEYNRKLAIINAATKKYNKAVAEHIEKEPATESKNVLISLFRKKYSYLYNTEKAEYNAAVESFNENHGMYFEKVKFQPLRETSENVFAAFIHAYAGQLQKYVKIWKATSKTTPTPLPKCDINPHRIERLKRNGEKSLDLCKRSIRTYKRRFEEAGILAEPQFHGSEIPVNYLVNPEILVIEDVFLSEKTTVENQRVNPPKRKELQHGHKVSSTGTIKNNLEKKGIVNSNERNAPSSLFSNLIFYKTTNLQGGKNSSPPAEKNSKLGPKILKEMPGLAKVLDQLEENEAGATPKNAVPDVEMENQYWDETSTAKREHRFNLAAELANGTHDFHVPIHHKNLRQLVENPRISDEEFLEIGKQCFIKTAAKLYLNNHPIAESWGAGIKHIDKIIDAKALNFNGKPKTKNEVYTVLMGFRFRLNYAIRKFKKMNWKGVWYPGVYFNPLRSLPGDVCFAYTAKVWTVSLKNRAKAAEKKRNDEIAARKSEQKQIADRQAAREAKKNPQPPTTPQEKLDNAIYKYLRKEYDLQKLTHYITNNLPEEWQVLLGPRLHELTLRRLTKNK